MQRVEIADAKLAEIVRRLTEAYEPEGIYLFGSSARVAEVRRHRSWAISCSTVRQAVEKAFKGFLAWHDQVFRKTHSLPKEVRS